MSDEVLTSNGVAGDEVPIPRFPELSILAFSLPLLNNLKLPAPLFLIIPSVPEVAICMELSEATKFTATAVSELVKVAAVSVVPELTAKAPVTSTPVVLVANLVLLSNFNLASPSCIN